MLNILKSCHDELCGGHFPYNRTTYKVLLLGYHWSTPFRDAQMYVKSCDRCQRMGHLVVVDEMPLQPKFLMELFEK